MAKQFFLLQSLFLFCTSIAAQSPGKLTIIVLSLNGQSPVDSAKGELFEDQTVVATGYTDLAGFIALDYSAVVGFENLQMPTSIMGQPYSNPSTGRFQLPFSVERSVTVEMEVFDSMGRRMVYYKDSVGPGAHAVDVNRFGTSSGVDLLPTAVDGIPFVLRQMVHISHDRAGVYQVTINRGVPAGPSQPAMSAGKISRYSGTLSSYTYRTCPYHPHRTRTRG